MREILFRGKRKDFIGGWVFGWYLPEVEYEDSTGRTVKFETAISHKTDHGWLEDAIVDPETVGQFTGLTDKNGKKIFEGDIVRDVFAYYSQLRYVDRGIETVEQAEEFRHIGKVGVVNFCTEDIASCGCCYEAFVGSGFKADHVDLNYCVVIGNIHDNPELVEEEA